jgi:hypothetical protein
MFKFKMPNIKPLIQGEIKQTTKKRKKFKEAKILQLPYDCFKDILVFLKIKDVFNVFLTCKTLHRLLFDRYNSYIKAWFSIHKNNLTPVIFSMILEDNFKKTLRMYGKDINHSFELLRTSLQMFALDSITKSIKKLVQQFNQDQKINITQAMQYILYAHIIDDIKKIDTIWLKKAIEVIEKYKNKYVKTNACNIYICYKGSSIKSIANPYIAFKLNNGVLFYCYIDKKGRIAHEQNKLDKISNNKREWISYKGDKDFARIILSELRDPVIILKSYKGDCDGYKFIRLKQDRDKIVRKFTYNREYSREAGKKILATFILYTKNILNFSQISKICVNNIQTVKSVKYLKLINANNKRIQELWGNEYQYPMRKILMNAKGLQLKNINMDCKIKYADLIDFKINNLTCNNLFEISKSYITKAKFSSMRCGIIRICECCIEKTLLQDIDKLELIGSKLSQVTFNKNVNIINFYATIKNLDLQSANTFSLQAMIHLLLYVKIDRDCFNTIFPRALELFLQKANQSSVNKFVSVYLKNYKLKYGGREGSKDYMLGTNKLKELIEKLCDYVKEKSIQDNLRNNINKLITMHNNSAQDENLKCDKLPQKLTVNQHNQFSPNSNQGNQQQINLSLTFFNFLNSWYNYGVTRQFQPPPPPVPVNNIQHGKKKKKKKKAPKKVYQQLNDNNNDQQRQQFIPSQDFPQTNSSDTNSFFVNQQQQNRVDNSQSQEQNIFDLYDDCFNLDSFDFL